jgi:hypothetical protein
MLSAAPTEAASAVRQSSTLDAKLRKPVLLARSAPAARNLQRGHLRRISKHAARVGNPHPASAKKSPRHNPTLVIVWKDISQVANCFDKLPEA